MNKDVENYKIRSYFNISLRSKTDADKAVSSSPCPLPTPKNKPNSNVGFGHRFTQSTSAKINLFRQFDSAQKEKFERKSSFSKRFTPSSLTRSSSLSSSFFSREASNMQPVTASTLLKEPKYTKPTTPQKENIQSFPKFNSSICYSQSSSDASYTKHAPEQRQINDLVVGNSYIDYASKQLQNEGDVPDDAQSLAYSRQQKHLAASTSTQTNGHNGSLITQEPSSSSSSVSMVSFNQSVNSGISTSATSVPHSSKFRSSKSSDKLAHAGILKENVNSPQCSNESKRTVTELDSSPVLCLSFEPRSSMVKSTTKIKIETHLESSKAVDNDAEKGKKTPSQVMDLPPNKFDTSQLHDSISAKSSTTSNIDLIAKNTINLTPKENEGKSFPKHKKAQSMSVFSKSSYLYDKFVPFPTSYSTHSDKNGMADHSLNTSQIHTPVLAYVSKKQSYKKSNIPAPSQIKSNWDFDQFMERDGQVPKSRHKAKQDSSKHMSDDNINIPGNFYELRHSSRFLEYSGHSALVPPAVASSFRCARDINSTTSLGLEIFEDSHDKSTSTKDDLYETKTVELKNNSADSMSLISSSAIGPCIKTFNTNTSQNKNEKGSESSLSSQNTSPIPNSPQKFQDYLNSKMINSDMNQQSSYESTGKKNSNSKSFKQECFADTFVSPHLDQTQNKARTISNTSKSFKKFKLDTNAGIGNYQRGNEIEYCRNNSVRVFSVLTSTTNGSSISESTHLPECMAAETVSIISASTQAGPTQSLPNSCFDPQPGPQPSSITNPSIDENEVRKPSEKCTASSKGIILGSTPTGKLTRSVTEPVSFQQKAKNAFFAAPQTLIGYSSPLEALAAQTLKQQRDIAKSRPRALSLSSNQLANDAKASVTKVKKHTENKCLSATQEVSESTFSKPFQYQSLPEKYIGGDKVTSIAPIPVLQETEKVKQKERALDPTVDSQNVSIAKDTKVEVANSFDRTLDSVLKHKSRSDKPANEVQPHDMSDREKMIELINFKSKFDAISPRNPSSIMSPELRNSIQFGTSGVRLANPSNRRLSISGADLDKPLPPLPFERKAAHRVKSDHQPKHVRIIDPKTSTEMTPSLSDPRTLSSGRHSNFYNSSALKRHQVIDNSGKNKNMQCSVPPRFSSLPDKYLTTTDSSEATTSQSNNNYGLQNSKKDNSFVINSTNVTIETVIDHSVGTKAANIEGEMEVSDMKIIQKEESRHQQQSRKSMDKRKKRGHKKEHRKDKWKMDMISMYEHTNGHSKHSEKRNKENMMVYAST